MPPPKSTSMLNIVTIAMVLVLCMVIYATHKPKRIDTFEAVEPTVEYPLIMFPEQNYGGVARLINTSNIGGVGFWARSMKLLPGKKLTVTHLCNNDPSTLPVTKTFTASTPNFNPCGWNGIFKNANATFKIEDDMSSTTDAFPVLVYSGPNYTGEYTSVSIASAPSLNTYVRSIKIKPGYMLTLKNHQCVTTPNGCSNGGIIPMKYWTSDNPNFSPCSDALKCYGISVKPNTLSIIKITPWTLLLDNLTHTTDIVPLSIQGLSLCGSHAFGFRGLYVGFYYTGDSWASFNILNETKPPRLNDTQGHYSDDIMRQIQFNVITVVVDRIGDGNSSWTYTLTRVYDEAQAQNSTQYFYDPTIPSILSKLRAPGNYNVLENNNTMVAGKRYISMWIERR